MEKENNKWNVPKNESNLFGKVEERNCNINKTISIFESPDEYDFIIKDSVKMYEDVDTQDYTLTKPDKMYETPKDGNHIVNDQNIYNE